MDLSADARLLWETATALARARPPVSRQGALLPPLWFFTDPLRTPAPWATAARLPAGAGVVFRHFGAADALGQAARLREATRTAGVKLLIGLDVGLADAVGADGVHLPERALTTDGDVGRPGWIVTAASHSLETASLAHGVDALFLSPIFPAGGASAERPALGLQALEVAGSTPVIALGGVGPATAPSLVGSKASGIAGVDAIQAAFGP